MNDRVDSSPPSCIYPVCSSHRELVEEIRTYVRETNDALRVMSGQLGEVIGTNRAMVDMAEDLKEMVTKYADAVAKLDQEFEVHVRGEEEQHRVLVAECALKHVRVDEKFRSLEDKEGAIYKRVEDMSDDSKVQYIGHLQEEMRKSAALRIETAKEVHEDKKYWKRYAIAVVIGIVMLVTGAAVPIACQAMAQLQGRRAAFGATPSANGMVTQPTK